MARGKKWETYFWDNPCIHKTPNNFSNICSKVPGIFCKFSQHFFKFSKLFQNFHLKLFFKFIYSIISKIYSVRIGGLFKKLCLFATYEINVGQRNMNCYENKIVAVKLYTTPLQEHAHAPMLVLHSCDDSQLWVKNVEKN